MARFFRNYNYDAFMQKIVYPSIGVGGVLGAVAGGLLSTETNRRPSFIMTTATMSAGAVFGGGLGFVVAGIHPILPAVVPFYMWHHYKYYHQ